MRWYIRYARKARATDPWEELPAIFAADDEEVVAAYFRGIRTGIELMGQDVVFKPDYIIEFSPGDGFRYKIAAVRAAATGTGQPTP